MESKTIITQKIVKTNKRGLVIVKYAEFFLLRNDQKRKTGYMVIFFLYSKNQTT